MRYESRKTSVYRDNLLLLEVHYGAKDGEDIAARICSLLNAADESQANLAHWVQLQTAFWKSQRDRSGYSEDEISGALRVLDALQVRCPQPLNAAEAKPEQAEDGWEFWRDYDGDTWIRFRGSQPVFAGRTRPPCASEVGEMETYSRTALRPSPDERARLIAAFRSVYPETAPVERRDYGSDPKVDPLLHEVSRFNVPLANRLLNVLGVRGTFQFSEPASDEQPRKLRPFQWEEQHTVFAKFWFAKTPLGEYALSLSRGEWYGRASNGQWLKFKSREMAEKCLWKEYSGKMEAAYES